MPTQGALIQALSRKRQTNLNLRPTLSTKRNSVSTTLPPKRGMWDWGGGAGRWESSSGLRFVDFCEVLLGYTIFYLSFGLIHQSFRRSRSCLSFEAGAFFNSSCGATSLAPAGLKAETHCQSTATRIVSSVRGGGGGANATSAGLMSSCGGDLSRLLQIVP